MNELTKKIKAAVIGDPISHSLSPVIHRYFLEKYSINGSYEAILLNQNELFIGLKSLIEQGFSGFNITIPHKESALKFCTNLSKIAKINGAINMINVRNDEIYGDNSDGFGFIQNLQNEQPNFSPSEKNVFVIGAGGASRAVIYSLIDKKAKNIFITNRNSERASRLVNDLAPLALVNQTNLKILNFDEFCRTLSICDLLVNTTSLGMTGQEMLAINLSWLSKTALVYDLVYKPLHTKLLQEAETRGNSTITGIGMLIEQAKIGFASWFGINPESDFELTRLLLAKL